MMDERVYYECNTCSYGVSGSESSRSLDAKLDTHEQDNPGHRMIEVSE